MEFMPRALPNEDAEVSKEIERQFKKLGVNVLTGTTVQGISDDGAQVTVTVNRDGTSSELKADKVLQAIGFRPNVEGYGLEATGVALTDRKAIGIDAQMRTNVAHLYAIGDVTAKAMLAHVAMAMGVVAAETIAGAETLDLGDYRMLPRATFCQPQVASFGLTEQQARDEGYDINVAKFPFMANGKAQGLGDPSGFVKLISDSKYGGLLGGHLIGPDVSELLPELTVAQKMGPDRQRASPQCAHPPHAVRGAARVLPRTGRPYDPLVANPPRRPDRRNVLRDDDAEVPHRSAALHVLHRQGRGRQDVYRVRQRAGLGPHRKERCCWSPPIRPQTWVRCSGFPIGNSDHRDSIGARAVGVEIDPEQAANAYRERIIGPMRGIASRRPKSPR